VTHVTLAPIVAGDLFTGGAVAGLDRGADADTATDEVGSGVVGAGC
jgi:hypothetical protein